MKIEINEVIAQQVQNLTIIKLGDRDFNYFVNWLLRVGISTVNSALEKNPELTLGDLVMLQYRNHDLH